jgi:hypothetical protein
VLFPAALSGALRVGKWRVLNNETGQKAIYHAQLANNHDNISFASVILLLARHEPKNISLTA